MKNLLLFLLLSVAGRLQSQCTPALEGDTTACPGIHVYTTDPGKTGYFWRAIGGTIIGESNTLQVEVEWSFAGILRITYDSCENPGVLIMNPCEISFIQEKAPDTGAYRYFDILGREIHSLSAHHGVYIRTRNGHSKLFSKP